uniref:MAX dimerization protein MLX n=1 Tax=Pipistrellus kuhlii TaxID=59472 RepID=A0A7J7U8M0_PIPKU|nr:MAX dimerization protein MLX [Pipistrellus kuhlii]
MVLQKTIDYIQFLHKEKKKQEEEVSTLRKDVMALKIMKVNYEQIVKAHQDNPHEGEDQVSDQVKFSVFQGIMDSLFQSFNASISMASFQELSACVFSWIEEHCKPQVWAAAVTGPGSSPTFRQSDPSHFRKAAIFSVSSGCFCNFQYVPPSLLSKVVRVSLIKYDLSTYACKAKLCLGLLHVVTLVTRLPSM